MKNFAYAWKEEPDATITWANGASTVYSQYQTSAPAVYMRIINESC